jgi:hypothetical protein
LSALDLFLNKGGLNLVENFVPTTDTIIESGFKIFNFKPVIIFHLEHDSRRFSVVTGPDQTANRENSSPNSPTARRATVSIFVLKFVKLSFFKGALTNS